MFGLGTFGRPERKLTPVEMQRNVREFALKDFDLDLCRFIVKRNGLDLEFIPDQFKDPRTIELALAQNGLALQFVQAGDISDVLCLVAVRSNGRALEFVPECMKINDKIIREALENDRTAIEFVPDRSLEFARKVLAELVKSDDVNATPTTKVSVSRDINYDDLSQKIMAKMESDRIKNMTELDKALEHPNAAMNFIQKDPKNIGLFPKDKQTDTLVTLAIIGDPSTLLLIKDEELRKSKIFLAVSRDGMLLEHIQPEEQSVELDVAALMNNGDAAQFIRPDIKEKVLQAYEEKMHELMAIHEAIDAMYEEQDAATWPKTLQEAEAYCGLRSS